jgi:methoxymalonate biosynthesis acyl carrier protein
VGRPVADAEESLLGFLTARTKREWDCDTDLFATGMSSLFAMELVVHLENEFGVTLEGEDLTLDNFRTVRAMTALLGKLRAGEDGHG